MSQRVYEILFIADPNLGEPEVDALTATLQAFVEKEGGKVEKVEKWGKKRLAYLVKRHREGSYVLMVAHGGTDMMREVERRIRVTDGVIKFMTVRVDEELKKADRRKAKRTAEDEKRRSRMPDRPSPASLPSAPPAEEVQL
ncbi:MAG TPA: 30S ribosomal protein S6 [Vicinamibacteria bacterium]